MEVHTHTHTARKKWTHYFWEFLMLFLAVFCGFLAENKREHMVNKKNEKKLIIALQKDIIKDTLRLHHLIYEYSPAFHSWVDSCHYDIDSLTLKGNERRIGKALFNATYWEVYSAPQVANNILKSPAAFNLIENDAVKRDILDFNSSVNDYEKFSAFLSGLHNSLDTSLASLINREAGRKYLDGLNRTLFFLTDHDVQHTVVFKTYDKPAFKKFINTLDQVDAKIHDVHYFYKEILNRDITLLNTITEEYHLKTE
jgi:hypothetical protein